MIDPFRIIKFRHLQCLVEVARTKSVGKAAEILNVSQPAVSKTLRELEDALDVKLFDRSHRTLELTGFGEVFLRHAGSSLTALRQGVDAIAQAKGRGGFTLTVGALPTVSTRVLPDAVQAFKRESIGTSVQIVTGENQVLMSQLKLGELDLVVGRLADAERMSGLTFEHLYTEEIGFFVREGHPLLSEDPFDLKRIGDFTVLVPGSQAVIRPTVEQFLIAHGIGRLPDQIETVSTPFGRAYVKANDAVWIISRGVVGDDTEDGSLVALPVDTAGTSGPVGLTLRADEAPSLPVQLLMRALRQSVSGKAGHQS